MRAFFHSLFPHWVEAPPAPPEPSIAERIAASILEAEIHAYEARMKWIRADAQVVLTEHVLARLKEEQKR